MGTTDQFQLQFHVTSPGYRYSGTLLTGTVT